MVVRVTKWNVGGPARVGYWVKGESVEALPPDNTTLSGHIYNIDLFVCAKAYGKPIEYSKIQREFTITLNFTRLISFEIKCGCLRYILEQVLI